MRSNPSGNCKDIFLKLFCKVVEFIEFIGILPSMTYCIAVNSSSVCWIICINGYSSCLPFTSNSLRFNKVLFNHKMFLAISWKRLWDWIIPFLTMLDRLAIAMLFTLVTVSKSLPYVIWLDRESTMSEVVACSPLSVSWN